MIVPLEDFSNYSIRDRCDGAMRIRLNETSRVFVKTGLSSLPMKPLIGKTKDVPGWRARNALRTY